MSWPDVRRVHTPLLVALLAVAAGLRLYGLAWDGGYLFHPDERFVLSVADQMRTALLSGERALPVALNPFWTPGADALRLFPYGHITVYAAALAALPAAALVPWAGVDPLVLGARLLAALADTAAVGLTYALGRAVAGRRAGLLAAGLLAFTVLHVQYAHFYTADTLLAPAVLAALLAAVRLAQERRSPVGPKGPFVAGLLVGLAVGVKVSAGLLLVPLVAAHVAAGPEWPRTAWRTWWRRPAWGWFWLSALAAGLAFAATNPYALLAWPHVLRSLAQEAGMVRGAWVTPFTLQYVGTRPYLYPFLQQARWFLGPLPALVAWGGVAVTLVRAVRGVATRAEIVVAAWAVPYVLLVGGLFAKFPRYWLAVVPAMYVLGSRALTERLSASPRARAGACLALTNALLAALAFVNVYRQPHPWLQASAWLWENVPAGSVIAVERWDHPLPLPDRGDPAARFRQIVLDGYDTAQGADALRETLNQADYVVLASPRVWLPLVRHPEGREEVADVYRRLLSERSAFRVVRVWRVDPQIGPVAFRDDPFARAGLPTPAAWYEAAPGALTVSFGPADEGFDVYDHPVVVLLARESPHTSP